MFVSALNIHPVKSTAIRPVPQAQLLPSGLADDRRWMVVDGDDTLVSARTDRRLFTIRARTRAIDDIDCDLQLAAPDHPALDVDQPSGPTRSFRLFSRTVDGVAAGDAADTWLRSVLQRDDVRLVWCADLTARRLDPDYARPEDSTAYADGYPVLLTSTASLAQLNDWMITDALGRGETAPDPLPMQRFRPNIVVDNVTTPFAEDDWRRVRIGAMELRVAKACDRCVMTLIDPLTLHTGHEPIRTLARYRRFEGQTYFGVSLIPDDTGMITVGDPVEVIETA